MVLKVLPIFILLMSFSTEARRSKKAIYFKRAQIQFKKKNYPASLKYLQKAYNFKQTKSIPASPLYLISVNYHKIQKYSYSIYFFNRFIKNNYKRKHIQVIQALRKDEVYEVDIPKVLNSSYFYLAQNYYARFLRTEKISDAKAAKQYFKICDETDFNSKCSAFLDNIDKKIEYIIKKRKNFEFFLYFGRMLYQDRVQIEENSSSIQSDLISNNSTICYGAGLRYGSAFDGYEVSGATCSGTTTVAGEARGESITNNYKQSGVPVASMLFELGYYIRPDNEKTRLGLSLPLIYRVGSYSSPDGYTINNESEINYGIMGTAGIQLPLFELQTKLGHLNKSNLLMINLLYTF